MPAPFCITLPEPLIIEPDDCVTLPAAVNSNCEADVPVAIVELMRILLFAVKVNVLPLDQAMGALTVMLPASAPAPAVVMTTFAAPRLVSSVEFNTVALDAVAVNVLVGLPPLNAPFVVETALMVTL